MFGETQEAILFLCSTFTSLISLLGNLKKKKITVSQVEKIVLLLVWLKLKFSAMFLANKTIDS